jgi:hypothetical protein
LYDVGIGNPKFMLTCFEILLGLKINFLKSEVIKMEVSPQEQERVTHMLNCKVGRFPLTYLGVPIADWKLTLAKWVDLVDTADTVLILGRVNIPP